VVFGLWDVGDEEEVAQVYGGFYGGGINDPLRLFKIPLYLFL
jgi:hypothetical protein